MTFSWDFNTATLLGLFGQVVLIIWFLVKLSTTAKSAKQRADEAHEHADAAHIKLAALSADHMIHREHVAREYVDKEDLKELKDAINGLRERIDTLLNRWHVDGKP